MHTAGMTVRSGHSMLPGVVLIGMRLMTTAPPEVAIRDYDYHTRISPY